MVNPHSAHLNDFERLTGKGGGANRGERKLSYIA